MSAPDPTVIAVGKALHEFIQRKGAHCPASYAGPWQHHYEAMARAALAAIPASEQPEAASAPITLYVRELREHRYPDHQSGPLETISEAVFVAISDAEILAHPTVMAALAEAEAALGLQAKRNIDLVRQLQSPPGLSDTSLEWRMWTFERDRAQKAEAALAERDATIARMRSLLEDIRDGNPDDMAADAVTCAMVWQRDARDILAAQPAPQIAMHTEDAFGPGGFHMDACNGGHHIVDCVRVCDP